VLNKSYFYCTIKNFLVFDVSEEEIGAADIFINITKLTPEEGYSADMVFEPIGKGIQQLKIYF